MGEILGPALILLIVIAGGTACAMVVRSGTRQRKAILNAPAIIVQDGAPPDALLANAQKNYILAERSVRVLDHLLNQPTSGLSNDDRKEAKAIVSDFYRH